MATVPFVFDIIKDKPLWWNNQDFVIISSGFEGKKILQVFLHDLKVKNTLQVFLHDLKVKNTLQVFLHDLKVRNTLQAILL